MASPAKGGAMSVADDKSPQPLGKWVNLWQLWSPRIIPPTFIPFVIAVFGIPVWVPAIVASSYVFGRVLDHVRDDGKELAKGIKDPNWQGSWAWMVGRISDLFQS